jgi:hypothetical protein
VFTEESSQHLTPLPEERGEPPVNIPSSIPAPPPVSPRTARLLDWIEVLKAAGLWILSVLVLAVVPVLTLAPYLIYRAATAGAAAINPTVLATDTMVIFYSVIGIIPAHLLTLYLAYLVVTEGGLRPFWKTLRWEWPESITPGTTVLLSVLIAVAL